MDTNSFLSVRPLFRPDDLHLVHALNGNFTGATRMRKLASILLPMVGSLGFCPLTLLLYEPIVRCLWPPSIYASPPNINDAIACFLVPAGMVYAISFGFAFQQVAGGFHETQVGVEKQATQLQKMLILINELTFVATATRVAMVREVKDMTFTSLSMILGQGDRTGDNLKGLNDLLRLLLTAKFKDLASVKDVDPWQRSVLQRLESLLSQDETLSTGISNTRIHALQWTFLETLGYFTFLGILLVQCSSYRANLSICLITIISISLLCYVVADLDSPFYGFFRVDLGCFRQLVEQLDHAFSHAATNIMLENSFVDVEVK